MTDYIATDGLYVLICTICLMSALALLDLLAMHIINRLEGRRIHKTEMEVKRIENHHRGR